LFTLFLAQWRLPDSARDVSGRLRACQRFGSVGVSYSCSPRSSEASQSCGASFCFPAIVEGDGRDLSESRVRVVGSKAFSAMIRASTSLPCSYELILQPTFRAYLDRGPLLSRAAAGCEVESGTRPRRSCAKGLRVTWERRNGFRGRRAGYGGLVGLAERAKAHEEVVDLDQRRGYWRSPPLRDFG
jgi:hypothetical protein